MLVDVKFQNDTISDLLAVIGRNCHEVKRLEQGVYQLGHSNFDNMVTDPIKEKWPEFKGLSSYGVCDNYRQILKKYKLVKSKRKFVVSICLVEKKKQSSEFGWRWHKWGPYIGTKKPTCEYLYDEPKIEKVFCFHILEME